MTAGSRRQRVPARAGVLATLVIAFALLLWLVAARWGPLHRLDNRVATSLHGTGVDNSGEVRWWQDVSDVIAPTVLRIVSLFAGVLLWLGQRRRTAVVVLATMAGAAALESIMKAAVARDRPTFARPLAHASGAAFPSGHAMTAFVAFGLLVLLVPAGRRVAALVVGVVAVGLVSFSRMALGVHYLSDVIGAWLLGAGWLVAIDWLFRVRSGDRRELSRR